MTAIVPITMDLALSYRSALAIVAQERRYLRLRDAPAIESTLAFVSSNIARGNPHVVAVDNGDVVGWCDICRGDDPSEAHSGGLGMGVLPTHRRRGVGTALLLAALDGARAAGFHRVWLEVYASNLAAIALYERAGFVHEGRLRHAHRGDDGYRDVLIMATLFHTAA